MLVGPDNGTIDIVEQPVHLPRSIGLLLQGLQELLEDAGLLPAVEAAGHRAPGTIALRQITPGRPSTQDP
jgi:hypothetical protein